MNNDEKLDYLFPLYLEDLKKKTAYYKELAFNLGNCFLRKNDFTKATKYYQMSIQACFSNNQLWRASGQANWIVDILILSKQLHLLDKVIRELEKFSKVGEQSEWPVTHYAFCITDMLNGNSRSEYWIDKLLERKKVKEILFEGEALLAIKNQNESGFNMALLDLLKVHNGQAKQGGLRWTAEGLICMPAMSMIYIAQQHGIKTVVASEYIVPEYFSSK